MDELTVNKFIQQRDKLLAILTEAPKERIRLLDEKEITEAEFDQLYVEELKYGKELNLLIIKFIKNVLTDISKPGDEIGQAATKLKKTLQKLDDFNSFLQVLGLGIELLSNILLAVQSGPGAIAKLADVINRISKLP
jgi:hypothetical protein